MASSADEGGASRNSSTRARTDDVDGAAPPSRQTSRYDGSTSTLRGVPEFSERQAAERRRRLSAQRASLSAGPAGIGSRDPRTTRTWGDNPSSLEPDLLYHVLMQNL